MEQYLTPRATLFVDWGIKSEDELFAMINKIYPNGVNSTIFARLLEKYPNDPSLGSPFNTGTNTFLKSPVFKQASALGTDALFTSRRRDLLRKVNQAGFPRTWSYHFEGNVPIVPGFLGGEWTASPAFTSLTHSRTRHRHGVHVWHRQTSPSLLEL